VIRVLIVASSVIARAGLESLLTRAGGIEIAGSVADWGEADCETPNSEDPDVIVAEEIPPDGLELSPRSSVVLLTADPQPSATLDLLRSGVRAVLPSDSSPAQIVAAIAAAAAGLVVVRPEDIGFHWLGNPKPVELSEPLTSRETEVLGMLSEGSPNKVIAHRLGISEHTVKFHVTSILSKLNATSRTEAVMLGLRQGLIML
jgi:NarL family two-component system response regulator YdfI